MLSGQVITGAALEPPHIKPALMALILLLVQVSSESGEEGGSIIESPRQPVGQLPPLF
jgi:hypothetical protein